MTRISTIVTDFPPAPAAKPLLPLRLNVEFYRATSFFSKDTSDFFENLNNFAISLINLFNY